MEATVEMAAMAVTVAMAAMAATDATLLLMAEARAETVEMVVVADAVQEEAVAALFFLLLVQIIFPVRSTLMVVRQEVLAQMERLAAEEREVHAEVLPEEAVQFLLISARQPVHRVQDLYCQWNCFLFSETVKKIIASNLNGLPLLKKTMIIFLWKEAWMQENGMKLE